MELKVRNHFLAEGPESSGEPEAPRLWFRVSGVLEPVPLPLLVPLPVPLELVPLPLLVPVPVPLDLWEEPFLSEEFCLEVGGDGL